MSNVAFYKSALETASIAFRYMKEQAYCVCVCFIFYTFILNISLFIFLCVYIILSIYEEKERERERKRVTAPKNKSGLPCRAQKLFYLVNGLRTEKRTSASRCGEKNR